MSNLMDFKRILFVSHSSLTAHLGQCGETMRNTRPPIDALMPRALGNFALIRRVFKKVEKRCRIAYPISEDA